MYPRRAANETILIRNYPVDSNDYRPNKAKSKHHIWPRCALRVYFLQSSKVNDIQKPAKKIKCRGGGDSWGGEGGRRQLGRRHSCRRWRAGSCAFPAATGMSPPQLLSPLELLRFFRVRRTAASAPSVVKKGGALSRAARESNFLGFDFLQNVPLEIARSTKQTHFRDCHGNALFQSALYQMDRTHEICQLEKSIIQRLVHTFPPK